MGTTGSPAQLTGLSATRTAARRWLGTMAMIGLIAGAVGANATTACDSVLQRYVRGGLVAYDELRGSDILSRCTRDIESASPDAMPTPADRLAFWINAYNLTVIQSVVRHDMPDRVTDVPGFFRGEKHVVAGRRVTLDEIESDIIRPSGDARIHAALVCAATSCPLLQPWAYTGEALDSQLDGASRGFLADENRNVVDWENRRVRLSKIFEWYGADFEAEYGSVMGFVRAYGPNVQNRRRANDDNADIEPQYLDYDWSLNRYSRD